MFLLFNFSSIFPGGSADPICPYVRTPMVAAANLPARRYASAVLDLSASVCVCVTSWYHIKTAGRIELTFGIEASFDLS